MKKQTETQKKNQKEDQTTSSQNVDVVYTNLFFLKGSGLLPLKEGQIDPNKSVERKFKSVKELEQLVLKNSKLLFGEKTFLIPFSNKEASLFPRGFVPKVLLLDLGNILKPRFYFLDIVRQEFNFYTHIFPAISKFISCFKNQELMEKVLKIIAQNKSLKKELQGKISSQGIADLIKAAISKPFILLVSDNEIKELEEVKGTYAEFSELVKCVFIRKFGTNGNTVISMAPPLAELHLNGKKRISNAPVTEEFHLDKASDEIKSVYKKIKSELLKANKQVQFNPQRYYISLRKDRNLAFFHFSKKNITLVVKVSHTDTKKQIKNYEIKTLTEKVQKFWGAASCAIVIDNGKKLQEVITLLKKLVRS